MGFGAPVSFWLYNKIYDECEISEGIFSEITKDLFDIKEISYVIKNKKFKWWNAQFIYNLITFEVWYKNVFKG